MSFTLCLLTDAIEDIFGKDPEMHEVSVYAQVPECACFACTRTRTHVCLCAHAHGPNCDQVSTS